MNSSASNSRNSLRAVWPSSAGGREYATPFEGSPLARRSPVGVLAELQEKRRRQFPGGRLPGDAPQAAVEAAGQHRLLKDPLEGIARLAVDVLLDDLPRVENPILREDRVAGSIFECDTCRANPSAVLIGVNLISALDISRC